MTEKELIAALVQGESRAFTFLYKTYYNMAAHYILKNSGNSQDAEDTFQETMLVFYEKCLDPSFQLSCTIKTYLYSVNRNLWLKKLRDRKIKIDSKEFEEGIILPTIDIGINNEEQLATMQKALQQLGVKCREIILQYYYYKQKMSAIATKLGYTNAANAKNQKYKCMQQLKNLVGHG